MRFDMKITARYTDIRSVNSDRVQTIQRVIDALKSLKFRIIEKDEKNGVIVARTRLNIWSWTEKVTIKIDPNGKLHIESKCSLPTQIVDWGKNRRNVENLFAQIA